MHPLAQPNRLLGLYTAELIYAGAALSREPVETEALDFAFGVQTKILLNLHLDPKPLAVETVLVALVLAVHGLVALKDVLVGASPRVVRAHRIVGRNRTIDEGESVLVSVILD